MRQIRYNKHGLARLIPLFILINAVMIQDTSGSHVAEKNIDYMLIMMISSVIFVYNDIQKTTTNILINNSSGSNYV